MMQLKHIFQPMKIGNLEVRNRVLMSGMTLNFGIDENGYVTPQYIEYFVERARGGPGMMIVPSCAVHRSGYPRPGQIRIPAVFDDGALSGLKQLSRAVHEFDARLGAQLTHYGCLADPCLVVSVTPEMEFQAALLGPGQKPISMSVEQVQECARGYGEAARRCLAAGFDFVEIEAAHPPALVSSFLSPLFNKRTDEYGGSFQNRIRFLLEVVRAVRKEVGGGAPVGMRVMADELVGEAGWKPADLHAMAPILEKEGIDYFSLAMGNEYQTIHFIYPSIYEPQGAFVQAAEDLKKRVSIPVAAAGRIKDPVMADRIVRDGKADLVVMARAHLADPLIVEKARNGDMADIRPCLADCYGCANRMAFQQEVSCTVNPRVGREYAIKENEGDRRAAARKVLVAGAGPSGLEAARRAAFAGHKVVLCETKGWIGGQLRLASMMPRREEMADLLPWYERQLNRLRVETRLNTVVDEDLLEQISPDVLVVATGSVPAVPLGFVVGLENVSEIEVLMIDDLLEGRRPVGDVVVIVGGGDHMGLQLADYLSARGARVSVVNGSQGFGCKMTLMDLPRLEERLAVAGVVKHGEVERIEILPHDDVWMVSAGSARQKLPGVDTLVFAKTRRPNASLAEVADRLGIETRIIGDASGVDGGDQGTLFAAIAAGYDAGRQI